MSTAVPGLPQPAARPGTRPRPRVRVVPPPTRGAPRAPFIALVIILLVGGLGGLLVLNMLLAQGSFTVQDLTRQVTELQDREQALQQRVAALDAPRRLARQATSIGMVPVVNPAFVRIEDGHVLGDPVVAPGTAPTVTSVTDPKELRVAPNDGATSVNDAADGSPRGGDAATANGPAGPEPDKSVSAGTKTDNADKGGAGGDKAQ